MRRFALSMALLSIVSIALGACASGKDTGLPVGPTTPPAGSICTGVTMNDQLLFVPEKCTIKVGTTLVWTNTGSAVHTVTSLDGKSFDSGQSTPINGGATFKFTFKTAGDFPYYCVFHSPDHKTGMVGDIKVET
jgi:plastocyanin